MGELSARLREQLQRRGWSLADASVNGTGGEGILTPIVPLIVGTADAAMALAAHLSDHGLYAPAIRPPTVAPGSARVRVTLRADLSDADLDRLTTALDLWSPPR
jgi:8-amino-7-oxononanoate synthase